MFKNYLNISKANPYSTRYYMSVIVSLCEMSCYFCPLSNKTDFHRGVSVKIPKIFNQIASNGNRDVLYGLTDGQTYMTKLIG